jgi:cytochrome c oxidase assembly protein subunit 11
MQHLISKNLSVFCFEEQELAPGEEALLPVRLIFDDELPDSIKSVVLSYTIFDVTDYNDLEMMDHHDGHEMEASL